MHHFCTYFDKNYLVRGLTMYRSLKRHLDDTVLWILCFDDFTYETILKIADPDLRAISLAQFERGDAALLAAKEDRSRVEYYFTCSPSLPLYVLDHNPDVSLITYVDADLFFYARPDALYEELGDSSILIVEHRLGRHLWDHYANGTYNVGLLAFRNNIVGRECLGWWRERCLEWCYDRLGDGGRFADQGYLNDWPSRFQGVVVLQNKGAGLAPWNWMNYKLALNDDVLMVDSVPLIFYHFQGVRIAGPDTYTDGLLMYQMRMPSTYRHWLYDHYVAAIFETWQWLRAIEPQAEPGYTPVRTLTAGGRVQLRKSIIVGRYRWWVSRVAPRYAQRQWRIPSSTDMLAR